MNSPVTIPGGFRAARLTVTLTALAVGGGLALADRDVAAAWTWTAGALVQLVPLFRATLLSVVRRQPDVDVIALLAIVGALLAGEPLAAVVVAVMLATGEALEDWAAGRAERSLTALLGHAPDRTHRRLDGGLEDVAVGDVRPGDVLVVVTGEVVPVDGLVLDRAVLDESTLTGEAIPVVRDVGQVVSSGVTNIGPPAEIRATATAAASTYAGIVRLVTRARSTKPPMVRLADRWAAWFVPLTLLVAGAAWAWSGDPVRALAVLVVATPCPLLLATPIAMVSGISRAARSGVIVKDGRGLEALARTRTVCLDKTGTLTVGHPEVVEVILLSDIDEGQVRRLAAAVEQLSAHPFAAALVAAAGADPLPIPTSVEEVAGEGVRGSVDGVAVAVGTRSFVADGAPAVPDVPSPRDVEGDGGPGDTFAWVAVDGQVTAVMRLRDPVRPEARSTVDRLGQAGVTRTVLVTGDSGPVATAVANAVGITVVHADCTPAGKVERVAEEQLHQPTAMVGDGVNDAPSLAAADVGIAMGARGATASSEAADLVVTADRIDALADVHRIAVDTISIARISAVGGMALSGVAMGAAAVGLLTPVAGAVLQEGIDVLAIAHALRALGPLAGDRRRRPRRRRLWATHPSQVCRPTTTGGRFDDTPPPRPASIPPVCRPTATGGRFDDTP